MKINIGPHTTWVGVYQLADLLQNVGVSERRCRRLAEKAPKWLVDFTEWIHSKKKRKLNIRIDPYDTWGMDSTLALIIVPMLKQLKATKHGAPFTDDTDVPEHLRSTACAPKENEYDTDANHFARWDWILDEMIWAWEQLHPDNDWEDQYHHGTLDMTWIKSQVRSADDPEGRECVELVKTDNDTWKFDAEGHKAHSARIDAGLLLFGKYTRALWD